MMPKPVSTDISDANVTSMPTLKMLSHQIFHADYKLNTVAKAEFCTHVELAPLLCLQGLYNLQPKQWCDELTSHRLECVPRPQSDRKYAQPCELKDYEKPLKQHIKLKRELEITKDRHAPHTYFSPKSYLIKQLREAKSLLGDGREIDIPRLKPCDSQATCIKTKYRPRRHGMFIENKKAKTKPIKHCAQSYGMNPGEQTEFLILLSNDAHGDHKPAEACHTVFRHGQKPSSISTVQRIPRANRQCGEPHQKRTAQQHTISKSRTTQPNEMWSWDCSKLAIVPCDLHLSLHAMAYSYRNFKIAWKTYRNETSSPPPLPIDEAAHRCAIKRNQHTIHQSHKSAMTLHRHID